jgi:phosphate/sulfate permease
MMLLNRAANMQGTTTDNSLVYQSNNGTTPLNGQGVYLVSLGYDAKITPKFYLNGNIGAAWAAKTNALKPHDMNTIGMVATSTGVSFVRGAQNGSNYMGSELNVEAGYKMYDNLTASLQAAYVMLGGYYHNSSVRNSTDLYNSTPENPYTVRTVLTYAF